MTDEPPDRRVPAYLGRVLDSAGDGVGTCFQIAPGLVATAWHVLENIGAGAVGAEVAVDPLAGGARIAGVVAAIDPPSDLAAVRLVAPLSATIGGLAATDDVELNEPVVIAGVGTHRRRGLDAVPQRAGQLGRRAAGATIGPSLAGCQARR